MYTFCLNIVLLNFERPDYSQKFKSLPKMYNVTIFNLQNKVNAQVLLPPKHIYVKNTVKHTLVENLALFPIIQIITN